MTVTSALISKIDAYVAFQNENRGQTLADGSTLPRDYDAVTGAVPTGGNAVTGISGISAGAPDIALPSSGIGNTVMFDGGDSLNGSTSGTDNYTVAVNSGGLITVTDSNTGAAEQIVNAEYLVFNGGATTSTGTYQKIYIIENGVNAEMAAMYNAAYGRVPDEAGLEFYIKQYGNPVLPDLHTLAQYFLAAPEFKAHWPSLQTTPDNGGPNDIAYIDALYGQILGRSPNSTEVQFYVNALQGKLIDGNGNPEPASDRADLLVYFSISAENTSKIAAADGGWLINPAAGGINETSFDGQSAVTQEVGSGTISSASLTDLNPTSQITYTGNGGTTIVTGAAHVVSNGQTVSFAEISTSVPNITINLASNINAADITGAGDIVNGATTGGSIVTVGDMTNPNAGGTVNLFGNGNFIFTGTYLSAPVTVAAVVNGWNSTDIIENVSLGIGNGTVYQGASSSPISGASLHFSATQAAINVGAVANDSAATMAAAANAVYKVGDVSSENAFFFGTDPSGNTIIYAWRGDSGHSGHVLASDFSGAVELVGVAASALTGANFH